MKTEKSQERKIHIILNEDVHKRLRVKCALQDLSMQDYVAGLLASSVQNIIIGDHDNKTIVEEIKK